MISEKLFRLQGSLGRKKVPPIVIPYGGWKPDLSPLGNPGETEALNVLPVADGYAPLKSLAVQTDALTARAIGAAAARDTSGTVHFYAGDATKLYKLGGSSFADASGATYTTAADDPWEFAQFGNTLVASNYADAVQSVSVGGATFGDLITSTEKPKFRHIDIIRDFLVGGNTNSTADGVKPNRVHWSALNDAADFDPDAATLCDYQDLTEGGWVQRVMGGVEFGLIFMQHAIYRMTFVGSPLIFDFDPVDRKRGTPIPGSVIGFGRATFFISEEGFFFTNGTEAQPIGHNQVDKTFWNQFDMTNSARVSATVDPVNKIVAWAFPGTDNTAGAPNKIFMFNWADDRWSQADVDTEVLVRAMTLGYTLETLDNVGTDIDDSAVFGFSFDSPVWQGGIFKQAAFDTDHKLNFFDGDAMAATITTGDRDFQTRGKLINTRPLVDGGTVTAASASRARLQDTVTYGSASSMTTNGDCPLISEGRYHRLKTSVASAGSWNKAVGIEARFSPTGRR